MGKILLLILATILTLSMAGIAVASNITNAEYKTTIAVTNNSTATTNVAVPFTLSTFEMIDRNMLSANASDAVMISSGGSDSAFMPASDNSSPWITWVSSIGTDSQVQQFLYSKEASGGKLRYFPDDSGMSANDSATLELGDNFTIEQSGWWDTTAVNSTSINKTDAFRTWISASGNITSRVWGSLMSPTGSSDPTASWSNDSSAHDRNTTTYAFDPGIAAGGWSQSLNLTHSTMDADSCRIWVDMSSSAAADEVDIDINSGGWIDIYSGTFTENDWHNQDFGATYNITELRIRIKNNDGVAREARIYEVEFGLATLVTATGISSGEHTVTTTANRTHFALAIDGVEQGLSSLADEADSYTINGDSSATAWGVHWRGQTFTPAANSTMNGVAIKSSRTGSPGTANVSIRATSGGLPTGTDLTSGTIDADAFVTSNSGAWYIVDLTEYNLTGGTQYAIVIRATFGDASNVVRVRDDVTAPTYAGGTYVQSSNSGANWTSTATSDCLFGIYLTHLVPDNSANWAYYENMGGYWEYTKVTVNGTLQQHIEWEYGTIFTDLSGNGHNVAPTFRTTSSNANVSAEVSQQEGLIIGSTPSSNVSGGWTMITSALETPENLFSEGGDTYSIGEFNAGELVTDYAEGAGHPPEPYHFLLAFGLALIVILGVYGFTHGSRMGRQGSLSLAFFAGGLVLIIFYRFETIPGWTLIPYGLGAILLIMWRRSPSPVD